MPAEIRFVGWSPSTTDNGMVRYEVQNDVPESVLRAAPDLLASLEEMVKMAKVGRVPVDIVLWRAEEVIAVAKFGEDHGVNVVKEK